MKGLKFQSSNKLKGAKFKRKVWMKNKHRIEAEARYGYKADDSDDETKASNTNHNLIASSTSHRSISLGYYFYFIYY